MSPASTRVRASAPAKTNLVLHVGSPTPDGYHPLETLFVAVDLRETVTATVNPALARRGVGIRITVEAERGSEYARMVSEGTARLSDVPLDETNLAVKAALAVCEALDVPVPGLELHVRKAVPVAGGMGGGSADAAAALVAVNELVAQHAGVTPMDTDELLQLGAGLGADVPFMLLGGAAIGRGTGTELEPVPAEEQLHFVFVPQDQGLSTPAVYRQWDANHAVTNASVTKTLRTHAYARGAAQNSAAENPAAQDPSATDGDPRTEHPRAGNTPAASHEPLSPGKTSPADNASGIQGAPHRRDVGDGTARAPRTGIAPDPVPTAVLTALAAADPDALAARIRNDLQGPAIQLLPELEGLLNHGVELGALAGWVSGSGPTVCFLVRSRDAARRLVLDFVREHRHALAVAGPVPGARVESRE